MVKWYHRAGDITAATQVYSGLNLDTRNNTVSPITVPPGYGHLKYITSNIGIDAAITADAGNLFVLKLSGDAMTDGDQEILIGCLSTSETGTSVTDLLMAKPAFVLPTNIYVEPGQKLDMSALYMGTDTGSQIVTASLGFAPGRGGSPVQYRTRGDSHTAATDVYEALETKPDTNAGTGGYEAPGGSQMINRLITGAVLNADADTIIAIQTWTAEISGDAVGNNAQEIAVQSLGADEGGGTVTATHNIIFNPAIVPAEVPLNQGLPFSISMAYKGTDLGTPFVACTAEIVCRPRSVR